MCLVAGHPLVRLHLQGLLAGDYRVSLLSLDHLAPGSCRGQDPDVFVLDTTPSHRVAEQIRRLRMEFPRSRFVLTGPAITDEELTRNMFMGIHGYLSYEQVRHGLVRAILSVSHGQLALSGPAIQMYISASSLALAERAKRMSIISEREREVIGLVARRLSNKEVAAALQISESTVKFHLSRVFAKLGVTDRWALEEKIKREEHAYGSSQVHSLRQLRDAAESG